MPSPQCYEMVARVTEVDLKEGKETREQGASRLERRAYQCAKEYTVDKLPDNQLRLLNRLPKVMALFREAYHYFLNTSEEELALSYAAEWLLDNFHVIEQANRQIKEDLPVGYYR